MVTHLGCSLLIFLQSSRINTTTLINQMTSGGRFTTVYMAYDDKVDMELCFRHFVI